MLNKIKMIMATASIFGNIVAPIPAKNPSLIEYVSKTKLAIDSNKNLISTIEENEIELEAVPTVTLKSLGTYKISAYCPCSKCCGKYANGYTASGTKATAGRTIAMNGVSFGTKIMIDGKIYIVEDRGGGLGKKIIDVYFNTHEEALKSGLWYDTEVYEVIEE
jgi:3D (Asp-Asp-Asp) domain-containing protein